MLLSLGRNINVIICSIFHRITKAEKQIQEKEGEDELRRKEKKKGFFLRKRF